MLSSQHCAALCKSLTTCNPVLYVCVLLTYHLGDCICTSRGLFSAAMLDCMHRTEAILSGRLHPLPNGISQDANVDPRPILTF